MKEEVWNIKTSIG